MVRFPFHKQLLVGENVLSKPTIPANAHGRLLGVLRYIAIEQLDVSFKPVAKPRNCTFRSSLRQFVSYIV